MSDDSLADYRIIILDDKEGTSSWGEITKQDLEEAGFTPFHFTNTMDSISKINTEYIDLLIVDMDLGSSEDGLDFQKKIRDMGLTQPVIFVTGNEKFLERPIFQYSEVFSRGPVMFFNKNSEIDLKTLVSEAINRIDPIRRSLYIMKKNGLGDRPFCIGDQTFTVDQLLLPTPATDCFVRTLRESLQELVLEIVSDREGIT